MCVRSHARTHVRVFAMARVGSRGNLHLYFAICVPSHWPPPPNPNPLASVIYSPQSEALSGAGHMDASFLTASSSTSFNFCTLFLGSFALLLPLQSAFASSRFARLNEALFNCQPLQLDLCFSIRSLPTLDLSNVLLKLLTAC